MKWIVLFSIFISAASTVCSADILFIDTNNAPDEIEAARKAAVIRGEKLIVIPARTPEQEKILMKMREIENEISHVNAGEYTAFRDMDQVRVQLSKERALPHPDPIRIKKLEDQENLYSQKMGEEANKVQGKTEVLEAKEAALKNTVTVSVKELQTLVDSYKGKKEKITSIIFSGHHDFSSYSGVLGTMDKTDVTNAFKSNPSLYQGIVSVYGLGCYSATPAEKDWWLQSFPNIKILGGYEAAAPGSGMPAGLNFLTGILVKEAQLIKIEDDKKTEHDVHLVAGIVRAIPGFTQANTAVCTRDIFVGNNTGAMDLTKPNPLCTQKSLDELKSDGQRFATLKKAAAPGVENIPCDGQHSWLRTYYTELRTHQHCGTELSPLANDFLQYTGDADRVIRIIDSGEIFENFKAFYAADFSKLNPLAVQCKISVPNMSAEIECTPPPEQKPTAKKITRNEILQFVTQLNQSACTKSGLNSVFLDSLGGKFSQLMTDVNCIPLNWVNPPTPGKAIESPDSKCL